MPFTAVTNQVKRIEHCKWGKPNYHDIYCALLYFINRHTICVTKSVITVKSWSVIVRDSNLVVQKIKVDLLVRGNCRFRPISYFEYGGKLAVEDDGDSLPPGVSFSFSFICETNNPPAPPLLEAGVAG